MNTDLLIEQALEDTLASNESEGGPPKLAAAIRHAVFPGGARIRPKLCLAVAQACDLDDVSLTMGAAVAIELLHCASLVHDDLPCFDDAETRRGQLSVHKAYGEQLAVLAGDALIIMAFQTLANSGQRSRHRLPAVFSAICKGVGSPSGITAGQAWECEPKVSLTKYQRAKTGSLLAAATIAGALSAGVRDPAWGRFGDLLGEAYQVADDIRDVLADPISIGKPVGRDVSLDRPSSARELGLEGAIAQFDRLFDDVMESIPECSGELQLRALARAQSERLVPKAWSDNLVAKDQQRVAPPSTRSVNTKPSKTLPI